MLLLRNVVFKTGQALQGTSSSRGEPLLERLKDEWPTVKSREEWDDYLLVGGLVSSLVLCNALWCSEVKLGTAQCETFSGTWAWRQTLWHLLSTLKGSWVEYWWMVNNKKVFICVLQFFSCQTLSHLLLLLRINMDMDQSPNLVQLEPLSKRCSHQPWAALVRHSVFFIALFWTFV